MIDLELRPTLRSTPEPDPAEPWCERCPAETWQTVETDTGSHPLCFGHTTELLYKLNAKSWNGGSRR